MPSMPSLPSLPSLSFDELTSTLNAWKSNLAALSTTLSRFQSEFTLGPESLYQRIIAQRNNAEIHPETQWDAEVRLGTDLSHQERAFLRNRREWMRTKFAKLVSLHHELYNLLRQAVPDDRLFENSALDGCGRVRSRFEGFTSHLLRSERRWLSVT